VKTPAELAGKSISVNRGSVDDTELTKVAPPTADVKRFEGNDATIAAYVAGQVQLVATSAQVAGTMMQKNPQLNTEYKFQLKDSPNFIGLPKGEDKLRTKVNEIIADAKKSGDLDKMAVKWLGRPTGDLPLQ
jgi:polar amino acid transport system substrate-binding protein